MFNKNCESVKQILINLTTLYKILKYWLLS